MSIQNKRLRRLHLPKDLLERLHRQNVITCADLLSKSVLELMRLVNRGLPTVHNLLRTVSQASAPEPITALELLNKRKCERGGFFPTSLTNLDRVLHGGLLTGTITEVAGPSGCGKTQLCLMLSIQAAVTQWTGGASEHGCQTRHGAEGVAGETRHGAEGVAGETRHGAMGVAGETGHGSEGVAGETGHGSESLAGAGDSSLRRAGNRGVGGAVIYIDTESAFSAERLVEMARCLYPDVYTDEASLHMLTSQIFIYREQTCQSLWMRLESLEEDIIQKHAKLVILDSVASLVRKEYTSNSGNGLTERTNFLAKEAALLKYLAEAFSIPIVVTNQITTHFTSSSSSIGEGSCKNDCRSRSIAETGDADVSVSDHGGYVTTALGNTWSHSVNTRLILQYLNGQYKQIMVAKSPIAPFITFTYTIQDRGIVLVDDGAEHYEGTDPGLQKIRVRSALSF